MTAVTYRDNRQYQELYFEGHAGDKIVCAGISAISQTLLQNLLREETRQQIRLQWKMTQPGEIWMRAWPVGDSAEAVRRMFEFTMEGLRSIAQQYPDNITIKEERQNGRV